MNASLLRMSAVAALLSLWLCLGFPNTALAQTGCTVGDWTPVLFGGAASTTGTGPAVVEFHENLWVFVTRTTDRVYAGVFRPSVGWLENYVSLSQNVRSGGNGAAAVVFKDNLYLFVIDPRGRIFTNVLPGNVPPRPSNFTGWNEVPGGFIGTREPAAVTIDHGSSGQELDLFVRAADGTIWVNILSTDWSGWNPVPGGAVTTHGPAAIHAPGLLSAHLGLYIRGDAGALYETLRSDLSGEWTGIWNRIGTKTITAAPAAVPPDLHNFDFVGFGTLLFTRGLGARIFLQGSVKSAAREVRGQIAETATAAPAAIRYQNDIHVFVAGSGDRLFCNIVRP